MLTPRITNVKRQYRNGSAAPVPLTGGTRLGTGEPCRAGNVLDEGSTSERLGENMGRVHRLTPNPKARPRSAPPISQGNLFLRTGTKLGEVSGAEVRRP